MAQRYEIDFDLTDEMQIIYEGPIDTEMSDTSGNPVQNKVIKQYVDENITSIDDKIIIIDDSISSINTKIDSLDERVTALEEKPIGIFIPSVSEEGIISWTNDAGLPNPDPRNIKGKDGQVYIHIVENPAGGETTTITTEE